MLTKWEIGQELIAISDYIGEKRVELKDQGHTRLANQLMVIQMQVGELFNDNNDHGFGIIDADNSTPKLQR